MATVSALRRQPKSKHTIPLLKIGDRLDQKTFHALYEGSPPGFRAELIGGIVHVSSPIKQPHSWFSIHVGQWLVDYETDTPGVEALNDPTDILDSQSEPQPDACLRVLTECGGQTFIDDDSYLTGPQELVVQISDSTERLDLNQRKRDCEKAGVREYLVIAIRKGKVHWFVRRRAKFKDLPAGKDGIFRSEIFPGLWLDAAALFRRDVKRMRAVLRLGLTSPEHAAFAAKLERRS